MTETKWSVTGKAEPDVVELVTRLLQLTKTKPPAVDRRKDTRTAFPQLITLTPIADAELRPVGRPLTVVAKSLAERGLDFFHCDPLPFKRTIVSFDYGSCLELNAHLVLNIAWCRFLRPGWYDSGGRFTHIVTPSPKQPDELGVILTGSQ